MLLYLIRHGDPIYDPDGLTELGLRQAEAVGKRLAQHGLDKVFVSTSERAKRTAKPTCELLKLRPTELEWCHEENAWRYFSVPSDDCERTWLFFAGAFRDALLSPAGKREDWYCDPAFAGFPFREGVEFFKKNTAEFLHTLGFDYDAATGQYKINEPPFERVALFAHQGFSMAFLSTVLRIPYPVFSSRFDVNHSGVTVLHWDTRHDCCFPKIIALSDCGHLYADGLPTKFANSFYY